MLELCWDIFICMPSAAFKYINPVIGVSADLFSTAFSDWYWLTELNWLSSFPLNKLVLSLFQRQRQCLLSPYCWGWRWGWHRFSTLGFQWAHSQVWLQHSGAGWKVLFSRPGSKTVALCAHVSMDANFLSHWETSGCPCHLHIFFPL